MNSHTAPPATSRPDAGPETSNVRKLDEELRGQRKRIIELEAAVEEMEAFSYSVSHDLRAPLRAIDGYSRILLEGQGAVLDADGIRMLNTVRNTAGRMAQLIEDLLAFALAGRRKVDFDAINMTHLAEDAAQTLLEAKPGCMARIDVKQLPPARGDRAMVRQVFANLLDNALKFSSRHPAPIIEIYGKKQGEWNVYCVKDNGVGFDECYAHKLFGVFQRLHSQDEFEGTGVGLALIQRIIHRHGGKVWAESKDRRGAAFYFSLR